MNKGILGGFISSDIKESDVNCKDGSTMKKAKFSIACQRKGKNAGADFVFVTALGKNAENIIKFFGKGRGITVEYHIQSGNFTNKEGKTVYTEDKIVDTFEFPYLRKSDEESTPVANSNNDTNSNNGTQTQEEPQDSPSADFVNDIPDSILDDFPFK